MKEDLSALLDGELSASEVNHVCATVKHAAVRRVCVDYLMIGAALRSETQLRFDVTEKVMTALENEATVLSPRPITADKVATVGLQSYISGRDFSALAATVAGVMLVAWVALTQTPTEPDSQLAAAPIVAPPVAQLAEAPKSELEDHLQEYVLAHQAHSSPAALMGGTRNVRVVSATQGGR